MIDMFAKKSYHICQIKIITTFFYRFFDEEIDIMQLPMFEDSVTQVYFLKKALYGLKQSSQV